jgi:phosphohistidine phosphatase
VLTLHLLRHAKSDWSDGTVADHDRPLNRRGKRARKAIARHVAGWPVDLVVCSTAARAQATAEPVVAALGCPLRLERALYGADVDELFDVVRALPNDVATVMIVGHNPGIEDFSASLSGQPVRYPTAALGTIELSNEHWSDVAPMSGTLAAHVTPAELADAD